jgi:SAM-dependent methyltransferase
VNSESEASAADDRWWRGFDTVVLDRVRAGSRVLDVGCGDGGFVERLLARGVDAFGVDPRAPTHPRLLPERVEDVASIGEFDAISAVMALHHTKLDDVVAAIGRLLRPDGQLFVYEFAWELYDERAAAWLAARGSSRAGDSVASWQREHAGLHSSAAVRAALTTEFELRETERPYLARMLGRHALEAEERKLIAAAALPALGRWYFGRRRPGLETA